MTATYRRDLVSQSDMHLEAMDGDQDIKWCIFTKGMRAPIAKIIVDTRLRKAVKGDEPVAHIVNVHVRPEYRGKRLGEHLVRLAQSEMKTNGFKWMTLEAEENIEQHGRLVRLYERCGFEVIPGVKIDLEYNGDECFRKVPMKCDLVALNVDNPFSMSVDPTSSSAPVSSSSCASEGAMPSSSAAVHIEEVPASSPNRYYVPAFVEELKRECVQVITNAALNMDVISALEWIDAQAMPGSLDRALRTGMILRSRGHPDWMELAGYLRFLGVIQLKWTEWHAPYMLIVENDPSTNNRSSPEEEDSEESNINDDRPPAKSGPMPMELSDPVTLVHLLDPERYAQGGIDEALVTWTPSEFVFLALAHQPFNRAPSAPREMAQCLRYVNCLAWLESDDFAYLEAYGDADLKPLVNEYRDGLLYADGSNDEVDLTVGKTRLCELVEKYVADVRVM